MNAIPEVLKSQQNTQAIEREIRSAFRSWADRAGCEFATVFEHGQWWVKEHSSMFEGEPAGVWSVNDASGPGSTFGFSFECVN